VLFSPLVQGSILPQATSVAETMPWRQIGLTVVVALGTWLIRRLAGKVVARTIEDRVVQYRWGKTVAYLTTALSALFIIAIWVDGLSQVGTFLGLVSAAVAIALSDVLVDVAGWLILITKPPFQVGDRIQIGPHSGDVVDISVLHFHLLEIGNWVDSDQSTGRLIQVPNSKILTDPIANYTSEFPFLWHEVPVVLTFESDWRRAKAMLLEMVAEASVDMSERAADFLRKQPSRMLISYSTVTATVYTSVLDHGICLTMRFLTEPRRRRAFDQTLWEGVLDIVSAEPDIELAYPTQRLVGLEPRTQSSARFPGGLQAELVER
jgi:small-conductance mechanosensitive channel